MISGTLIEGHRLRWQGTVFSREPLTLQYRLGVEGVVAAYTAEDLGEKLKGDRQIVRSKVPLRLGHFMLFPGFVILCRPDDWEAFEEDPRQMQIIGRESLELARRTFPGVNLSHAQDHNLAEALLIAEYCRLTELGRRTMAAVKGAQR